MSDEAQSEKPATPSRAYATAWAWFNAVCANSPVSRDVAAWNHLRARLPELTRRLDAEPEAAKAILSEWFNACTAGTPVSAHAETVKHLEKTLPALLDALTKE